MWTGMEETQDLRERKGIRLEMWRSGCKNPAVFLLRRLYFIWKTMQNDKGI